MSKQLNLLDTPVSTYLADVRKHTASETVSTDKGKKVTITNPNVKRKINVDILNKEKTKIDPEIPLFLTNNRTIQQNHSNNKISRLIKEAKVRRRGEYAVVRSEPSPFCKSMKTAKIMLNEYGFVREVKFYRMSCNSWTCPNCCKRKANRVRREIIEVAELNDLYYHLVLTLDDKKIPDEYKNAFVNDTHKYITKIFNHFMTLLKRTKKYYVKTKTGKTKHFDFSQLEEILKYIWIIEFQTNTHNAHMHILLNQFLPIEIIRELWTHVGGGVQMHVERVRSIKGVSIYVAKYITKGLNGVDGTEVNLDYGFKYFERRYAISNSCIRKEKHSIIRLFDKLPTFDTKVELLLKQGLDWIATELNNIMSDDFVEVLFDT